MAQFCSRPDAYPELIRAELPLYDELQKQVAAATRGLDALSVLELGTGTGETAARVLALHPRVRLTGIDSDGGMLAIARRSLEPARVDLLIRRLEERLPTGSFDLVVSALAVHHVDGAGKRDLFARVRDALEPGGRFVLGDVVVPERPEDAVVPLEPGYDLPDRVDDQLAWLEAAGLAGRLAWSSQDLAVLVAERAV